MSKDVDTIQFRNDNGDYVYAKTHFDAIDGMEEYTEGLTWTVQFIGNYIFDTGWIPFDYNAGYDVKINTRYSGTGFECGIRETTLNQIKFGNGNSQTTKMIRINAEHFTSGTQLFQLPTGFVKEAQRFQMSGSGHRLPYTLEILPDGKVMVFVHPSEQDNSASSNWIYGQYTWVE
ncbi:hypothetical protein [Staphylococcus shinii]|uniref:hypothetical protein n=1 Tax=Staphylococcus shinii TaxID=2912228 RepID=UPI003F83728A